MCSDLTSDDGKSPPKKPSLDLEHDTIYMPFTSSSSGEAKGVMHTSRFGAYLSEYFKK